MRVAPTSSAKWPIEITGDKEDAVIAKTAGRLQVSKSAKLVLRRLHLMVSESLNEELSEG